FQAFYVFLSLLEHDLQRAGLGPDCDGDLLERAVDGGGERKNGSDALQNVGTEPLGDQKAGQPNLDRVEAGDLGQGSVATEGGLLAIEEMSEVDVLIIEAAVGIEA